MKEVKNINKKDDRILNVTIVICILIFLGIIAYIFIKTSETNSITQTFDTNEMNKESYESSEIDDNIAEVKLDGIGLSYTAGNYICGIDFPAGKYDIQASKGRGNVFGSNGLNEIMSKDADEFTIDNYNGSTFILGDVLSITSTLKVTFGSNSAEIENYTGREETKDTIELETGNYLVGTDIPYGTYNIVCTNGSGNIYTDSSTFVLNETMTADDTNSSSPYADLYIKNYNNAILEDGIILSISGIDVKLTLTQPIEN